MKDPKEIHDFEQVQATLTAVGAHAARFYRELTENGVPGDHAAHIVGKWVAAASTGGRRE